jgi:hypothetical protein
MVGRMGQGGSLEPGASGNSAAVPLAGGGTGLRRLADVD